MKTLLFTGKAVSYDKDPLFCCEETEAARKEVVFSKYPLSLLKVVTDNGGVTVDDIRYDWEKLPVTINRTGRHVTRYRDIVEEHITITVEFKDVNADGN